MNQQTHNGGPEQSREEPAVHATEPQGDNGTPADERKRPGKKPLVILAVIVVIAVIAALTYWLMNRGLESTDDAFTDGNAAIIAPKTSGYIVRGHEK